MKLVIINFSGNVGKTTVARHLAMAHMPPGTLFMPVESVNDNFEEGEKVRAARFDEIVNAALVLDDAVFDVGASNAEEFINKANQRFGCTELFDLFLLPVTDGIKQQRDTMSTVSALVKMNVPANRIVVIPNRVDQNIPLESSFAGIFEAAKSGAFMFSPKAIMRSNEVFDMMRSHEYISNMTLAKLASLDHRDIAVRAKATKGLEQSQLMITYSACLLAASAIKESDDVWREVMALSGMGSGVEMISEKDTKPQAGEQAPAGKHEKNKTKPAEASA